MVFCAQSTIAVISGRKKKNKNKKKIKNKKKKNKNKKNKEKEEERKTKRSEFGCFPWIVKAFSIELI